MAGKEADPQAIFEKTLTEGVVLLSDYLPEAEVAGLAKGSLIIANVARRAPRYGRLAHGLMKLLGDTTVDMEQVDLPYNHDIPAKFHTDDKGLNGISLLTPVSGPPACFYFSEVPQAFPDDTEQSRFVRYGAGDVVVLRQDMRIQNASKTESAEYGQIYHHGVASQSRLLVACDLIQSAVIALPDPVYDRVAGFADVPSLQAAG